jgi:glyoxylase-like metal-dependent hydrolase (beta-lactamase superfamily II)
MREDPLGFYPLARQADPDFPVTVPVPDHLVADGQTLSIAGLRLLVTTSWLPGESATATTYEDVDQHRLFVGDLVDNAMTPALLEGHSCGWLRDLNRLEAHYPAALEAFPGHGSPAPLEELVTAQRIYLRTFRQLVGRTIENGSPRGKQVTETETAHVIARMRQLYPGYPNVASLPTLKQVNVSSVAKELQARPRCVE